MQAIDHIAAALARLPHQYHGGSPDTETNTQKALRIVLKPTVALQQAMLSVLTMRVLDTAVGVWLDVLGTLVGRPRNGIADDDIYRRYIRAQIASNKSNGTIDEILTIAELVINDPAASLQLDNTGDAAYILMIEDAPISSAVAVVLMDLMQRATSAGVQPILSYTETSFASVLLWDTQGVWDTALWGAGLHSAVLPDAGYPMSAAEMALAIPGGTFTHGWLCDESSGDLESVFGGLNLTASGTGLFYGDAGPRSGVDRAIGFTTGAATGKFSAAAAGTFDIAASTDELVVAWVGKWSALPTAFGAMFGKATATFTNGWHLSGQDGSSLNFELGPSGVWRSTIPGTSGFLVGSWHVGIAVIDRSGTDTARFGVRDLAGVSTIVSTGMTGINGNTAISASIFTIGRSDWVPGNDNFRLAALYIGKGSGVAAGLASNLPAVLASFAARIAKDL